MQRCGCSESLRRGPHEARLWDWVRLTRCSLPLAGAVVTEVLLTFALHWCGAPLGPALAAVVVYRLFNLVLAAGPSLLASRGLLRTLGTGSICSNAEGPTFHR